MFIINKRNGSDIVSSVFVIALFIFLVFTAINILFQANTRARVATGMDIAARYLATHKDASPTDVNNILNHYIDSSLISTATITSTGWTSHLGSSCVTNGTGCDNDLRGPNGLYDYRTPFILTARFRIPPVIPLPFLMEVNATLYVASVTEILE